MGNLKERFLSGASAAIILGTTLGGACANPNINTSVARPTAQFTTENTWNASPALERLKRLELKTLPEIKEFNLDTEISLATAQFYCEQTKCNKSPEQMANSVVYLDEKAFISKLEANAQKKFTTEEIDSNMKKQLAFTTEDGQNIYINETLLKNVLQEVSKSQPEILTQLGAKNLEVIAKKSILIHEFTHMNTQSDTATFSAFSISLPSYDQPINFDQLKGFQLSGKSQDEKRIFYLFGGDEAVTERAAQIIADKSRSYIGLVDEYESGANFIYQLNSRSGVANGEFLKYANGQLPSEELIKKWGKGNLKNGIMMLAAIGLNVQGLTSTKETQVFIDNMLKNS